ncbi:MAG: HNH endonuclease family protein [Acidiferrobacter sp.]
MAFADKSGAEVDAGGDYAATSDTVLETFLKPALARLRSDKVKLNAFVRHYTDDLTGFFGALEQLIEKTHNSLGYHLLWVIQDLSATLYPLVIRLHTMGWVESVGSEDPRTLLQLVELTDLRVFKLRRSNPQADMFRITRALAVSSVDQVAQELIRFCRQLMPDTLIATRLVDAGIYNNPGLKRMLLQVEELARVAVNVPALALDALKDLNRDGLTVEHVLSQDPGDSFHVSHYEFSSNEDYEQNRHRLGNLLLLESRINSACRNRTVEDKMSASNLYPRSKLCAVQALSARHAGSGKRFGKATLGQRSLELAQIVMDRWHL